MYKQYSLSLKSKNNLKMYQVCQTGTPQLILKNEHDKEQ
jgi:hypothetical protein